MTVHPRHGNPAPVRIRDRSLAGQILRSRLPVLPSLPLLRFLPFLPLLTLACASAEGNPSWLGRIDTLPSGTIVVTNPAVGIWDSASAWRVVEELRVGTVDDVGPALFGEVAGVEIDAAGRLYVLEGQAQEIRVFDRDGRHIRTIGRKGGGPGEFNRPIGMAWSPAGDLWVVDPQNNRISVIDTAGTFVTSHPAIGGWIILPWPGGFDTAGAFYTYAPNLADPGSGMSMVRFDAALNPLDTLEPPRFPGEQEYFELRSDRGHMLTGVPFSPSLEWSLTRAGDFWAALTGSYELLRTSGKGDTLRRVTRPFDAVAVTDEDVDSALADLEWFISQGGKVDRSRIPDVKPALRRLFVADDGHLWVGPTTRDRSDEGYVFDIFDPEGRYLGAVRLPFPLSSYPPPVIRNGVLVGVTEDELEVPFVVKARVVNWE